MVAEKRDLACPSREEVGELGEYGLLGDGVGAVGPEVVQEHGDQGDDEEGRVDVRHKVGFRVRVVCEDGLVQSGYVFLSRLQQNGMSNVRWQESC